MQSEINKQKKWLRLVTQQRNHEAMLRAQLIEREEKWKQYVADSDCYKEKLCTYCPRVDSKAKMFPKWFVCDESVMDAEKRAKLTIEEIDDDYIKYPILMKFKMEDSLARIKMEMEKEQNEILEKIKHAFLHKRKKPATKKIEVTCIPEEPCTCQLPAALQQPVKRRKKNSKKVKDMAYFTKNAVEASRCANKKVEPCCKITYEYDPDENCPKLPEVMMPYKEPLVEQDCTRDIYLSCRRVNEGDICKVNIPHPARFCSTIRCDYELVRRKPSLITREKLPPMRLAFPCMKCIGPKDQLKINQLREIEEEERKTARKFDIEKHEILTNQVCPHYKPPEPPEPPVIYKIDPEFKKSTCFTRKFDYVGSQTEACRKETAVKCKCKVADESSLECKKVPSFCLPVKRDYPKRPNFSDIDAPPVYVKPPEPESTIYWCPTESRLKKEPPEWHSPKVGWRCKEDFLILPHPVQCRPPNWTPPLTIPILRCSEFCSAQGPFESQLEGLEKAVPPAPTKPKVVVKEPPPVHKKYDRDGCPLQPFLCPPKKRKRICVTKFVV